MNIVLDTNLLNSYLYPHDINHLKAKEIFKFFKKSDRFIIPLIVVFELFSGTEDKGLLWEFLTSITPKFEPNTNEDIKFIAEIDFRQRKTLKAGDCAILAICNRRNAKLMTFDKKLQRIYKEIFRDKYL